MRTRAAALFALLCWLAGSFASAAQTPARLPRVAVLSIAFGAEAPVFEAFRDELKALGQVEGKSFALDLRVAPDRRAVPRLADELVRSSPAVLVALNAEAGAALQALTRTIPIVIVNSGDPVALGLTSSLARPSGNVTGIVTLIDVLSEKRLELVRELVPAARRVGLLYESGDPLHELVLANTRTAARNHAALEIVPLGLVEESDLDGILGRLAAERIDAMIVAPSPHLLTRRQEVIAAALANRLPTMHAFAFEVQDGALAAYGTDTVENFQRAAQYVDRLLGGARIAELPFDTPRAVAFTLNRATARAIGLDIPASVGDRADEVIE